MNKPAMRPLMEITGLQLQLNTLKSKEELLEYLQENGPTHSSLMEFCEGYVDRYGDELCWPYLISDGEHMGTFLVLVKEGVVSLPYDEAGKTDHERFCLEDAKLFHDAGEMEELIANWDDYDSLLRQAMQGMKQYLQQQEGSRHGKSDPEN